VSQIFVFVKTKPVSGCSKRQMPIHSLFLPVFVPLHLGSGRNEKLHFHLFEFAHPEYKLPGYDFIPEGFTDLGDPKGDLLSGRFHYIEEIDKNSLRGFGAEVKICMLTANVSKLGGEHQVELAYIGPVART